MARPKTPALEGSVILSVDAAIVHAQQPNAARKFIFFEFEIRRP